MGVDLSVFGRQKSLTDVQNEFEARKQAQMLQQLQVGAALAQANNGGLTAKDKLGFQLQMQNHADDLAFKQLSLQSNNDLRRDILGTQIDAKRTDYQQKLDDKIALKMSGDQNVLNSALDANNQQLALIEQVKTAPGIANNFGVRGAIPVTIPGSDTANAKALLDQLNARGFVGAIGNMKSQSATGASGLGGLSEREGDKVQAAAAALQQSQSVESFNKNLERYQNEIKASNSRLTNGFNNIYGRQQSPVTQQVQNSVHWNDLK